MSEFKLRVCKEGKKRGEKKYLAKGFRAIKDNLLT